MNGSPEADRMLTSVYLALIAGVAMFAVILIVVIKPIPAGELAFFRPVWLVLAVGSILAAAILKNRLSGGATPSARLQGAVVVWALAEGPTLFGLVGFMLTGDRVLLFAPLAFFAIVMLRYPPRVFRDGG